MQKPQIFESDETFVKLLVKLYDYNLCICRKYQNVKIIHIPQNQF